MKRSIIFILILNGIHCALAQNLDSLRYAFLNEKIENDTLSYFPLSERIRSIDTSCFIGTYLSTDDKDTTYEITCFDLELILSKHGLGAFIDTSDILEEYYLDIEGTEPKSIRLKLNRTFRKQIYQKSNKQKWDKEKLTSQIVFKTKKKSKRQKEGGEKGQYSMSYPIFFENQDRAIIFITVNFGPLFTQGYVEYYEKAKTGNWEMIKRYMIWMS